MKALPLLVASVLCAAAGCSSHQAAPPPADGAGASGGTGAVAAGGNGPANAGSPNGTSGGVGLGGAASGGKPAAAGTSGGVGLGGAANGGAPASGGGGAPVGGSAGAGAGAGAPATGGGAGMVTTSCNITVQKSISEKIATVGIVQFTTDLAKVDSASIQFGLDTNYGLTAPVDLTEPSYRTLLLGMKTSHTYHFRVVAVSDGKTCMSADDTIDTGPGPNGLAKPTVVTNTTPDKLYGGYMVTARWGMNNGGPAMILDADGDLVWWYAVEDDVIRARFSYDGKRMWIRNTSETDGGGWVRRVTLDGLTEEKFDLTHTTHDLVALPDGDVGLISHASNGCWEVVEFNPSTMDLRTVFNLADAHGSTMCQVNYLAYFQGDDSFFVSDYDQSTVVKISRQGELKWVLNGTKSTISGTKWTAQHGIHALGPDHLIVFSNKGESGQPDSIVYELTVDETAKTATTLLRYDGGLATGFGGDVQRLDNGNLLITYSSSGVIQELGPDNTLLQSFTFPIGGTLSYMEKRRSLYASPPPKINGI